MTRAVVTLAAASMLAVETKFSNGLLALATTFLIAVLAPDRPARARLVTVGWMALASAVAGVGFWLVARQQLGDILPWLRGSYELTTGYAEAMAFFDGISLGGAVIAVLVTIALAALAFSRVHSWAADWPVVALAAWGAFLALRLGFTRIDGIHLSQTFILLLGVAVAIGVERRAWAGVLTAVVASCLVFVGWQVSYFGIVDPATSVGRVATTGSAIASTSLRGMYGELTVAAFQSQLPMSDRVRDAIGARTVHIDPLDAGVALAYDLNWKPVPVFQSYSAYTPYLDELNAAALRDPDGPEVVVRVATGSIDHRNPMWESPGYMVELVCNFEPDVTEDDWLVLERVDRRCSDEPTEVATVSFAAGETVKVPKASNDSTMIVATVHTERPVLDRIASALFRPTSALSVTADEFLIRLPVALEDGPLIMHLPESAGWADRFGGDSQYDTLTFSRPGTITFSAIRVDE